MVSGGIRPLCHRYNCAVTWSVQQVDKEALDLQVKEKEHREEAAREEQHAHGESEHASGCGGQSWQGHSCPGSRSVMFQIQ